MKTSAKARAFEKWKLLNYGVWLCEEKAWRCGWSACLRAMRRKKGKTK